MGLRLVKEEEESSSTNVAATRQWAPQQLDIFNWFANGGGNLVVRARAGTGKTTTLCEGVTHAPEENIFVTSFGNRIVRELTDRLEDLSNVLVKSLHGVGLQSIRRVYPKVKVDERNQRAMNLTSAVCPPSVHDSVRRLITKAHTKARESMPYCSDADELVPMVVLWDLVPQFGGPELVAQYAFAAMKEALKPTLLVDFADMIYLPLRNGYAKGRFPLIVVDEAQDMNAPQLDLAQRLLLPDGRMAVIGDDRQGIYAFRGADSQALDRLKRELSATELPLTVTYRCGKRIVQDAQMLVPDIQAHDTAQDGTVREIKKHQLLAEVQPGDFVLSRLNAPLVRIALSLIRDRRRAKIEGRDIGQTLVQLARRFAKWGDVQDLETWYENLDQWEARQIQQAEKLDLMARVDMVRDQADCMRAIADDCKTVAEIESRITEMFDDTNGVGDFVICSSVHRAKGLEAERVFLLRDTLYLRVACLCGHRHPRSGGVCRCSCADYQPDPVAEQEERNIAYVAITRAKSELIYVVD